MAFVRVFIAISVISEFVMNTVQTADWMFLRTDGERETQEGVMHKVLVLLVAAALCNVVPSAALGKPRHRFDKNDEQ
jgi:hypothetical protein